MSYSVTVFGAGVDFFDDDCPICRLTRRAEQENRPITLEEFKVAFEEVRKIPGTVVGSLDKMEP